MYESVVNLLTTLGWDWAAIAKTALAALQALVAIWVAGVATFALQTWKRQSKAQRQADFLDELTEEVHKFISLVSRPVEMVRYIKIAMAAHAPTHLGGDQKVPGAIAYIQKRGADDSKRLFEYLETCRPTVTRIRSLAAKGQVFHFKDYPACYKAVQIMAVQFDGMEALASMISSPSWNWENPEVVRTLEGAMSIECDDIKKQINEQSAALLSFVSRCYAQLSG